MKEGGSTVGTRKQDSGFKKTEQEIIQELNSIRDVCFLFFFGACLVVRNGSSGGLKVHLASASGISQIATIRPNVCRLHPFHNTPARPNPIPVSGPVMR